MKAASTSPWSWLSALSALLSEAYLEPEADVGRRAAVLADTAPFDGPVRTALTAMSECRESPVHRGTEYVRLFFHGVGNVPAHPYESVQLYGRLMAPECLGSLGELYDEADVRPRADLPVPPDHLGLELEFLSFLLANLSGCEGEHSETERWAGLARRLVANHLEPFSIRFVEKVEAASPSPFFHQAGAALLLGLEACRAQLSTLFPAPSGG